MQRMHKIQVLEAQSDVAFAKLQLQNAQKFLDSAKIFKSLIEQVQKLREGKNLAGKIMHF